jgi:hypothetical protein
MSPAVLLNERSKSIRGAAAVVIDKRGRPQPAHRIDRRQSTPPGARLI